MAIRLCRLLGLILVLTAALGIVPDAAAQTSPEAILAELRRANLTPAEARQLAARYQINLDNPDQAIARARELGIPEAEIQRLLELVESGNPIELPQPQLPAILPDTTRVLYTPGLPVDTVVAVDGTPVVVNAEDPEEDARADSTLFEGSLEYFGYRTFANTPEVFSPTSVGPVDDDYVINFGDQMRLTITGSNEFMNDLAVDRDGRIFIQGIGYVPVAGRRLSELRLSLRRLLGGRYAGLVTNPQTAFMDLTVTQVRPVQILITGEVANPGGYTVPSGSNVFNALYLVGGPLVTGSLRDIRVYRAGRLFATVDAYDFLIDGSDPSPVRLQAGDRVFVPTRGKTASVRGEVRRPAIYELLPRERFEDLLDYAGGLEPDAYAARFQIERIIPFAERTDPSIAREVVDLSLTEVLAGRSDFRVEDGDRIRILETPSFDDLSRQGRLNAVLVEGAVVQPGRYQLSPQVRTVRDLLAEADGLSGDAYRRRAELTRLQDDLERELIRIDLDAVLRDDPAANLPLRSGDVLRVYAQSEIESDQEVFIRGRVLRPGAFPFREEMTVGDLLFQGGGLLDPIFRQSVFLRRADLYRTRPDGSIEIISFDLEQALEGEGLAGEPLQPRDVVQVYNADVERVTERFVEISGEVRAPGRYPLTESMTVQDLILAAGGFEEAALANEVEVARLDVQTEAVAEMIEVTTGAVRTGNMARPFAFSDIAISEGETFSLQHRDHVFVRRDPNFSAQRIVQVGGQVRFPGDYALRRRGETLTELIARAGGLTNIGYAQGGRLQRNGQQVVVQMQEALAGSVENDIELQAGDLIVIPARPNTVEIRGAVGVEGLLTYRRGRRVRYYLDQAGGLREDADEVYITQASGATYRLDQGLFDDNPIVDDGAVITVTQERPADPEAERDRFENYLTIVTGAVTGLVPLLIILFRN